MAHNKRKARTIFRAPAHDMKHPYVMVSNATAQDSQLSFEARGLLLYLLSQADNWYIQITDLQRKGRTGRDRVNRIMKELEENGCAIWGRSKRLRSHSDGTFEWLPPAISERPFTENPQMAYPSMDHPVNGKSVNEKPSAYKVKNLQSNKSTKEEEILLPPFNSQSFLTALRNFEQHLKEKGAKQTPTARKALYRRLAPLGEDRATRALIFSTAQNYTGVFEEGQRSAQNQSGHESSSQRNVRNLREGLDYLNSLSADDREAATEGKTRLLAS
jgi:hypothetical protein